MLPEFYISCFQSQLSQRACITLQILVFLLQFHKQVQIEKLAALFTMPIKFESRRRHIQRFLLLPRFQVKLVWFPIVKQILKRYFKNKRTLKVALDRTQWQDRNVFVISLIWDKRSLPLYWEILPKRGSSHLREQKALIRPILRLLKGYKIILLGDREFGHVRLAAWLDKKHVGFALRTKANKYIRQEGADFQRLNTLGLAPGRSFYLTDVFVTKQPGFGTFEIAAKWARTHQGKVPSEGWYLLTNLGSLQAAINAYKARSGIEAMFKDCKTGGYNLEKCQASDERLSSLVLLIAIAYSCAILRGRQIKAMGYQNYICRLKELRRTQRRHSTFWVGLYGQVWISGLEFCTDLVHQLMKLTPNKLESYQQGLRAMRLILSSF